MKQKIAIISDIHGNIWALEEVLKDIKKRKVDLVLNLGDSLYGGLDPAGCADILMNSDIISILGNEDIILLEENVDKNTHQSYEFTKSCLCEEHLNWIKSFEKTKSINNEIYICHGALENCTKYLIEDVSLGYPKIKPSEQLSKILSKIPERVICCGHSHLPNVVKVSDKMIVNPGSVGIQAFVDNTPNYHIMESGSPHARYSILDIDNAMVNVENYLITYDWNKAAETAMKHGRKDWAQWIKTGRII